MILMPSLNARDSLTYSELGVVGLCCIPHNINGFYVGFTNIEVATSVENKEVTFFVRTYAREQALVDRLLSDEDALAQGYLLDYNYSPDSPIQLDEVKCVGFEEACSLFENRPVDEIDSWISKSAQEYLQNYFVNKKRISKLLAESLGSHKNGILKFGGDQLDMGNEFCAMMDAIDNLNGKHEEDEFYLAFTNHACNILRKLKSIGFKPVSSNPISFKKVDNDGKHSRSGVSHRLVLTSYQEDLFLDMMELLLEMQSHLVANDKELEYISDFGTTPRRIFDLVNTLYENFNQADFSALHFQY